MDDIASEIAAGDGCVSDDEQLNHSAHRQPKLPLSLLQYKETPRETCFHRSARICLEKIRECLFQHQWQDAAVYLISYFQTLEDSTTSKQLVASEIIWRLGAEILHHHPNAKLEDVNHFFDLMKNTGVRQYLKVCLEHAFHLLLNGSVEDASRQLSMAESWRYGKQSALQADRQKLIRAYRGFLDYITWMSKNSPTCGSDDADVTSTQEMHSYFRQASVSLQEILKVPGVWDPFVTSYVNMLEFYNDHDGALTVLKEYAYNCNFPPNPNAHVYLYRFLKKHGAPEKKLIQVLQILQVLVPSHELMLELCSFLLQAGDKEHLQKAVHVVFNLLDDSSWKHNVDAWTCLKNIISVLRRRKLKCLLEEEWEMRKDWWPAFHFRTYHARLNFAQSEDLMRAKSFVAGALTGHKCMYRQREIELFKPKKRRKTKPAAVSHKKRKCS